MSVEMFDFLKWALKVQPMWDEEFGIWIVSPEFTGTGKPEKTTDKQLYELYLFSKIKPFPENFFNDICTK